MISNTQQKTTMYLTKIQFERKVFHMCLNNRPTGNLFMDDIFTNTSVCACLSLPLSLCVTHTVYFQCYMKRYRCVGCVFVNDTFP